MRTYEEGAIVTVPNSTDPEASNTYIVESDCGDSVLLRHPLFPECLMRFAKSNLDLVAPNIKDSAERGLDFVNKNLACVDYNTKADHAALCLYFVVKRQLTPRQKNLLANMCGSVASVRLQKDVKAAMELVEANQAILDDFNAMWFKNFRGLFSGKQPITSSKQTTAIFNMAGFVMAELERPVAANGYN